MLIKQLLDHTPTTHIDYTDLSLSLEKIIKMSKEINLLKKKDSSVKVIHELESKISDLPFALSPSKYTYIWKGELYNTSKPNKSSKTFCYILFNCCLIYSKNKGKKFEYITHWDFKSAFGIHDRQNNPRYENCFEIFFDDKMTNKRNCLTFSTPTPKEKDEWIHSINSFFETSPESKLTNEQELLSVTDIENFNIRKKLRLFAEEQKRLFESKTRSDHFGKKAGFWNIDN